MTVKVDNEERSLLYRAVNAVDKVTNWILLILLLILLLYAGYSIWYVHAVRAGSFLPDELAEYRPDGEAPTLDDLMQINPDVNAWLTIDDTRIDYPVVQGEDDAEYLNKNVMGGFSFAGSIFLSALNSKNFSDSYNMVYGHHVKGGAMFSDVMEFRDAEFFNAHRGGTLWYGQSADKIEIFASVETSAQDAVIYQDPGTVNGQALPELVEYIRNNSVQYRDPGITENDRIIVLSTCEDAVSFGRVLLFGKLRPMTDAEMKAAQNKEKEGAASTKQGGLLGGILGGHPWILPSAGALFLLLIIYLLYRLIKKRRERKKQRERDSV